MDQYVARRWVVTSDGPLPTPDKFVSDSIVELRKLIPPGLTMQLPDHDCIVETWL